VHTVELLPDLSLDDGVRALWSRLRDAGLPSLATHPHPTNRPHLTVITAGSLDGLPPVPLPLRAELGAVRLLGRALVREVTPTPELRDFQALVSASLRDPWPPPAEWAPHISLALKVTPAEAAAALASLGDLSPARGHFTAARTYDTATREITTL
jgi:hypothetical protein